MGEIPWRIHHVRDGTHFPGPLEPRQPSNKALLSVIHHAHVEGVSTRRVHDLLQTLGLTWIDKNRVSRICNELDEVVGPFRNRPLEANALSSSCIRSTRRCAATIAARAGHWSSSPGRGAASRPYRGFHRLRLLCHPEASRMYTIAGKCLLAVCTFCPISSDDVHSLLL